MKRTMTTNNIDNETGYYGDNEDDFIYEFDDEPENNGLTWVKNEVQTYIREVIVKENSPVRTFIGNVITNFKWFITELAADFDEKNENNGYVLPMYYNEYYNEREQ
jgi:hypothetical protein